MSNLNLKGLWIPLNILSNPELTDKEKMILSIIIYLSKGTKSCFASNKYIASIVKITANRVSKIVSSLKYKGYVKINLKYKIDTKEIEERQIIPMFENNNRYSQERQENNYSGSRKRLYPMGENDKDIRYNIKNKKIYNNKEKGKINYEGRDYSDFDFSQFYSN